MRDQNMKIIVSSIRYEKKKIFHLFSTSKNPSGDVFCLHFIQTEQNLW